MYHLDTWYSSHLHFMYLASVTQAFHFSDNHNLPSQAQKFCNTVFCLTYSSFAIWWLLCVELCHPNMHMMKSFLTPVFHNVNFFGDKVFTKVISLQWEHEGGLDIMCLYKMGKSGHQQGECHMKMKMNIGVKVPQAIECQRWTANHQKLKKGIGQILFRSPQKQSMLLIPWC